MQIFEAEQVEGGSLVAWFLADYGYVWMNSASVEVAVYLPIGRLLYGCYRMNLSATHQIPLCPHWGSLRGRPSQSHHSWAL